MADFDILARLRADVKNFQKGFGEASKTMGNFMKESGDVMKQVGDNFMGAGKAMTTALTLPIAAGVTAAVKSFADLEQAVGGIETMFKDTANDVIRSSETAYKRAGVSGVEYMEQVTSFSATLLQGLGGDTEKAAAYADKAIVDMSDNANKFGTNIADIQNAYQGFSKDNYTINLLSVA